MSPPGPSHCCRRLCSAHSPSSSCLLLPILLRVRVAAHLLLHSCFRVCRRCQTRVPGASTTTCATCPPGLVSSSTIVMPSDLS
ncbi:hypothetical protein PR003_g7369 [Phytophthora rubi]|uniref:Uncharacterized protein n=1 Tax=Phytophthora rubi TaxID=129364 RepID=A0A6A3NKJ0_9STRA|nr:hypothetical protein PR002_g7931 [Phytophthora rubi]KAE9040916.1 hypothetical protein PR001_g6860 [Phytophthora rubi]KAE9346548.1 hypothetical protein PR003_g7369 [Phytophthora rubi]